MSVRLRALIAALVVVLAAAAGTLYLGQRHGIVTTAGGGLQVAMTAPIGDVLGDGSDGDQLVDIAMHQIEKVYYRPIATQTMLDGERKALLAYLKDKHVPNASLPPVTGSGNVDLDSTQAEHTLDYAQAHYAKRLGSDGTAMLTEVALTGIATMPRDPYTEYLSPREVRALDEMLSGGDFGGIGVYIQQLKDGRVFVLPITGLPAATAGMRPGDVVVSVDGKKIAGKSLDTVEQMIRGPQGTAVRLAVYPYNAPRRRHTYTIVRQIIHVPTVYSAMEGKYDYVRLSDFGETSYDEMRKALLNGKAHHARGYILDLRDDGGGLVDAAVNISSLFIPSGPIVSTIDRDGNRVSQYARSDETIPGLKPLVVLVNKYTASAAEITSGAIQDYRLGTIIGTKTFGKGVVQTIFPMPDAGALKITTERYVTPRGRDIQHRGIMPDVYVAQNADDPALIGTPHDKQLAAAKTRLALESR